MSKGKKRGTAKTEVKQKPMMTQAVIRNRIASHFTNLIKIFRPTKADAITAIAWFAADVVCQASFGPVGVKIEDVIMTIRGNATEFKAAFDSILENNIKILTERESTDGK